MVVKKPRRIGLPPSRMVTRFSEHETSAARAERLAPIRANYRAPRVTRRTDAAGKLVSRKHLLAFFIAFLPLILLLRTTPSPRPTKTLEQDVVRQSRWYVGDDASQIATSLTKAEPPPVPPAPPMASLNGTLLLLNAPTKAATSSGGGNFPSQRPTWTNQNRPSRPMASGKSLIPPANTKPTDREPDRGGPAEFFPSAMAETLEQRDEAAWTLPQDEDFDEFVEAEEFDMEVPQPPNSSDTVPRTDRRPGLANPANRTLSVQDVFLMDPADDEGEFTDSSLLPFTRQILEATDP